MQLPVRSAAQEALFIIVVLLAIYGAFAGGFALSVYVLMPVGTTIAQVVRTATITAATLPSMVAASSQASIAQIFTEPFRFLLQNGHFAVVAIITFVLIAALAILWRITRRLGYI